VHQTLLLVSHSPIDSNYEKAIALLKESIHEIFVGFTSPAIKPVESEGIL
jgi:hypothetical protein